VKPPTENPREWARAGRGLETQFFATDDEIVEILETALPSASGPFHVLGHTLQQNPENGSYEHRVFTCAIDSVLEGLSRASGRLVHLGSEILGGMAPATPETAVAAWSLAGLPLLEHGFAPRGRREGSRIAVVRTVRHVLTGDVAESPYLPVYRSLAKEIRRRRAWSAVRRRPDGSEDEDDRLQLMTDAAAAAAIVAPEAWAVRPGRRLR